MTLLSLLFILGSPFFVGGFVQVPFGAADNVYHVPEYRLSRELSVNTDSFAMPSNTFSCGNTLETPKEMEVNGVKGWRYFMGGATWCDVVFEFTQGEYTYKVERNLARIEHRPPGAQIKQPNFEIDSNMRYMIMSVSE